MKKSLLIATILVIGLLVVGCFACGEDSSTSTSRATSSTAPSTTGSATSTSTTLEQSSTTSPSSSTTLGVTSTTVKPNRYEQNDAHLVYSGEWKTSANAGASGGTFAYTNWAGGKVTITFEGTHLALIAKKSPKYGKANITLDGKNLGTIDLYNAAATYQKKVWGTGQLKPGTHTVVIAWTGAKRSAATDTNISIDCVLVTGTLK